MCTESALGLLPDWRRVQFRLVHAHDLIAGPSQERLCLQVGVQEDPRVGVGQQDGVLAVLEQMPIPLLLLPYHLFGLRRLRLRLLQLGYASLQRLQLLDEFAPGLALTGHDI